MSSAICLNLDETKILSSGNGLNTWMLYKVRSIFYHAAMSATLVYTNSEVVTDT